MKKIVFYLFVWLLPMTVSAVTVEIDGIWYNIITKSNSAEVTRNPNLESYIASYSGSVIIPDKITYNGVECPVRKIGDKAFYFCKGLTSVTIPNGVNTIGENAFNNCQGLASLTIPNSVTKIESFAFWECSSLTAITIPNSVTTMGQNVFYHCSSLISVTLSNSVTSIGGYAFSGCTELTSITIPNSVTEIGIYAFQNCEQLADVYCLSEQVRTSSYNGDGLYTHPDAFAESYQEDIKLHVPSTSIEAYKLLEPWSHFKEIVALTNDEGPTGPQKCAIPQIKFVDGKLQFSCETSGASFVYSITNADIKSGDGNEVQLGLTFKVSVYAKKDGYENSDVSTREIVVTGIDKQSLIGDINFDGKVNATDIVMVTNMIMNK